MGLSTSDSADALMHIRRWSRKATGQLAFLGINGEIVGQINDKTTPAGLVAGANAGPIVTMEVLMKQQIILPVGIALEGLLAAKNWPLTFSIACKNGDEPVRELLGDLIEVCQLAAAGWEFNLEVFAVVTEVDTQGANNHEVNWHPDRTSPVAVAAKKT